MTSKFWSQLGALCHRLAAGMEQRHDERMPCRQHPGLAGQGLTFGTRLCPPPLGTGWDRQAPTALANPALSLPHGSQSGLPRSLPPTTGTKGKIPHSRRSHSRTDPGKEPKMDVGFLPALPRLHFPCA